MAIREIDAIGDAIIATEKEIAGDPWGDEETEGLDASGDRSNETMGEGLEGQHEPDDNDEDEGEESESESESEEEGEGEADEEAQGETKPEAKANGEDKSARTEPEGRVPPGRLRERTAERDAAVAERDAMRAERDALKTRVDTQGQEFKSQLDLVLRQLADLRQTPRATETKPAEPQPDQMPDVLDDPAAFADHLRKGFQSDIEKLNQEIRNTRFQTSLEVARARHGDTFDKAFEASQKLNPQNPEDLDTGRRIFNSPNPGEALVAWHKRNETLREVGDNPAAFKERIAKETREALMKDPEFRKQIIADLRGEANAGDDGRPRTVTRLPRSLNGAAGRGASPVDPATIDDSDQGVAESAWR